MTAKFIHSQHIFALLKLLVGTLLFGWFILWLGCAVDDDDDNPDDSLTDRETAFNLTAITNEDGKATVSFNVAEGTSKFSISAASDQNGFVRFDELRSADGIDYLSPGGQEISLADSFFGFINSATVPSRDVDPNVNDQERYVATAESSTTEFGSSIVGDELTFSIISKADPDLNGGRMPLNLFYVGDVGQQQTTREVVATALTEFRRIYAEAGLIRLDIVESDIEGPVVLPSPVDGDEFYRAASIGTSAPTVNLFIGGDIEDLFVSGEVLGVSAGIPGPPFSSERSAVSISIFAGAGADGVYSAADVQLLGETFAHEVGHFLGLFHPVDFSGSTVIATDPLEDTDTCSFITECVANDSLITNLMFPSPVPDGNGGFHPQIFLTGQQRGVQNRYIAVD